jgi:formate hydrogenlyase subunit 5
LDERRIRFQRDRARHRSRPVIGIHDAVVEECLSGVPLGAYAGAEAANYLFLRASGAYAHSHVLGSERRLRAVSATVPLFSWDEREMAQDWGVRFDGLPDDRPLHARDGVMPAAHVVRGEGLMQFVVGPVHAGIIEPGRFTFSSGGETIAYLDAQLGYSHRGVERALEGLLPLEAAAKVARICGGCSASRSFAYARAIEALADFAPEQPVDFARVILAELERIYNHLADLAAGAAYVVGFTRGMTLKERAMRLCHAAAGHRLLFDAIAPGGFGRPVLEDRPGFAADLGALERDVHAYLATLFGNASMVSRWERAGVLSPSTAKTHGAVGPALRGSGGLHDVRAFAPYGAYRWLLPMVVASATSGDALARCAVKRDELRESFGLIARALAALGESVIAPQQRLQPQPGIAYGVVEGPRGTECVAVHVGSDGTLERVHVIAASYRNWPLVTLAMKDNIVPDFPLVNKSFNLCYACVDR